MTEGPVPDRAAAHELGVALDRVGYTEENVLDLLGDDAYGSGPKDLPVLERRLPETRLATAIRLFFLELAVPAREAVHALGPDGVAALEATGLAVVGKEVEPRSRILAVGDLLVASDVQGRSLASDYVGSYTPSAHLCASLTPRAPVARALDVGTGSGVQALLCARHAEHVIATDVNDRALAYTQLNAALNDVENVECRQGSLFDPVAGETFDLITCNAPFVVSPEDRLTYRDGGMRGDEFSERVVRGAAEQLAPGGYAALLASWIAADDAAPDARALAWIDDSGCDAWILSAYDWDPLDQAADWNSHLAGDPEAYGDVLDDWTEYFEELGASSVIEGAIVLHRTDAETPVIRSDSIDADDVEDAGEQVLRAFDARARLAELAPDALIGERLVPATALRLERELEPREGTTLVTRAGIQLIDELQLAIDAPEDAIEVVAELDGRASLGEAVDAVAGSLELSEAETAELLREAVELCTELLELGALRFV